jgi:hypothetical protein
MIMPDTKGTRRDGIFYLRKIYDYEDTEDMAEFEDLMDDLEAPVHEVDYQDECAEVLIRPDWRR